MEDEQYLSDMYKLKFEQEGYKVTVAPDGPQGLALAEKERPDLVLLDLVLPGLDGFQVLKKLREGEATKKIKVFILSNLGQSDEVKRGMNFGANGYFVKADLTPSQLTQKVNALFAEQKTPAGGKKAERRMEEPRPAAGEKSEKILLIEDEEAIVNMYKLRFENEGYRLTAAKNGAWGIKLARQKKFDLILLDMVMPALGGCEALKILKADPATTDTPIIILSNSAQDKDIERVKKLGAAACLLKSAITPAKLVKEAEKILKKFKHE